MLPTTSGEIAYETADRSRIEFDQVAVDQPCHEVGSGENGPMCMADAFVGGMACQLQCIWRTGLEMMHPVELNRMSESAFQSPHFAAVRVRIKLPRVESPA
jgi:hypothetical protein